MTIVCECGAVEDQPCPYGYPECDPWYAKPDVEDAAVSPPVKEEEQP